MIEGYFEAWVNVLTILVPFGIGLICGWLIRDKEIIK